jgi:hypothetical protein
MSVELEMMNEENGRLRRHIKTLEAELNKQDAIAQKEAQQEPNSWEALYWEQVTKKEAAVKKMNKVNDILLRAQKEAQQEPCAWLSEDSIGERYLSFDKPVDDYPMVPLYTTTPNTRAVLRQALEALDDTRYVSKYTHIIAAIAAIREVLK